MQPGCLFRANKKGFTMLSRRSSLRAVALLATTAFTAPGLITSAKAQSSQQVTVDGARKVLADLKHDKEFGNAQFGNAQHLMRQARAVMIVPKLLKGGFIVGGEGGDGVLMARGHDGWSDPAFYVIGAASFGLQIGLEQSEMILLIMTKKGLDGVLHDQFKIGAQAGISVATLGAGVEGAIGGVSPPDIVVWSSSTGLYGGLTVDGSIIRSEPNQDSAYYGRTVTSRDVLFGKVTSPHAHELRQEINAIG
jgi:lipid-binding SYLF domain-containing protein